MAANSPIYDLTLLLDLGAADDVRAKIVADTRTAISAEGELLGEQSWGTRALAYEIDHRESAEYHLLQFSGPPTLIASLDHTLRIIDGVIRHRVIKLPAGATVVSASTPGPPPAPPAQPAAVPAAPSEPPPAPEPAEPTDAAEPIDAAEPSDAAESDAAAVSS
jgi:small subunit ribosomal protein S6